MSEEHNSSGQEPSFHAFLYQWAARISVIALEMVIPAVIGVGLDRLFGTVVLFAILGVIFGMALVFWQLIRIAKDSERPQTHD
jgi:F0F1-type ATP synthase assembly protein I